MASSEGHAEIPSGRLFFERRGEGSPIVFLHAGIADRRMWGRAFEHLAAHYTVVRYDRRGFGHSPAPTNEYNDAADLGHLMDQLELPTAYLVGLSEGGRVALDFATLHPERVDGLVAVASGISGYVPDGEREEQMWMDLADRDQEISKLAEADEIDRALEQLLDLWAPAVDRATRKWLIGIARENLGPALRRSDPLQMALEPPAFRRLAALSSPLLAITGTEDFPGFARIAERLAAGAANATHVQVQGADHFVNLSQPDKFEELLTGFLARLDFILQQRGSTH
ncbi:MAG: alpha/beta hydrolase [Thermoplasmata archaeon]|nr:alpha/beta hydrolase [Thermoplasmata archaeon]